MEGLEAGASALLLDEDTCATNFMIRDERMQRLVSSEKEPIRPFISRVRSLWDERCVTTMPACLIRKVSTFTAHLPH